MSRSTACRLVASIFVAAGVTAAPLVAPVATAAPPTAEVCAVAIDRVDTYNCASTAGDARLAASIPASYVLGATLFDLRDFNGAELRVWVPRACSTGYDAEGPLFRFERLGEIGWGNRATSVTTANQCDVKLYDVPEIGDINAGSTWIHRAPDLSTIGSGWNNRASAIRLS